MSINIAIFAINLKRNKERRKHICGQLDDKGLSYEIIEAIDGRQLNQAGIEQATDRIKS